MKYESEAISVLRVLLLAKVLLFSGTLSDSIILLILFSYQSFQLYQTKLKQNNHLSVESIELKNQLDSLSNRIAKFELSKFK